MPTDQLQMPICPRCADLLDWRLYNRSEPVTCPGCRVELTVTAFPRLFDPVEEGAPANALLISGEASCFHHADKQAVAVCEGCGRFMCSLCDMEIDSRHLCPACLAAGVRGDKIKGLQRSRTRYDNVALAVAVFSWLSTFSMILPFFLAPAAIFLVFRYWKAPRSPVRAGNFRFILALLLAVTQVGLGLWFLVVAIGG